VLIKYNREVESNGIVTKYYTWGERMKKKIMSKVVVFTVVASLLGASSVSAAEENQITSPVQQEKDKDEKIDDSIKEGNVTDIEPAPGEIEAPETPPNENKPDEVKPEEPEVKPEEPSKPVKPDKDDKINDSLPDTETDTVDDKDMCIGIDGEEEPYEIAENLRATTIPGKWIQAADGRWWYRHDNGTYTKNGWEYINGQWYYFDGSGWMVTGWIQLNGTWYYLSVSGAMATGWYVVNGKWYYSDASGAMQIGWILLNGKWYYLKTTAPDSGSMLTGWQQIGGRWYYMNSSGAMQTGWLTLGVKKYYLNSSGAMVTGSQTIGGSKYYFVESGELGQHRTNKHEKGYFMTDFNGSRVGVRVYAEITEDIRPETSTTIALVKRTGLLYYRAGGTAGFNFTGSRPRHFNSSKNAIKSFSWQTQSSILPGDAVISMSIVNRTKVVYSNTNTNYSQLSYLISGQPGIESGGVRSGDAKMLLKK
jgi:hypothetical protein